MVLNAEPPVAAGLGGILAIPRFEFAAIIPKGPFATVVMVGEDLDQELVHTFLNDPVVKRAFPTDVVPCVCSCSPLINLGARARPYADRVVMVYPVSRLAPGESQIIFDGPPDELDNTSDRRVLQFTGVGETHQRSKDERLKQPQQRHGGALLLIYLLFIFWK